MQRDVSGQRRRKSHGHTIVCWFVTVKWWKASGSIEYFLHTANSMSMYIDKVHISGSHVEVDTATCIYVLLFYQ
jgi:hypothetical protein